MKNYFVPIICCLAVQAFAQQSTNGTLQYSNQTPAALVDIIILKNEQIIDLRVVKLLRMYYYIDIGSIENIKVDAKLKKIINKFLTDYYDSFTGLYLDKKVLEFKE